MEFFFQYDSLLAIAEETLAEFLSKATGTAVDWVQMVGMKPGPDSIGIIAVSYNCSGVAAQADQGLVPEPQVVAHFGASWCVMSLSMNYKFEELAQTHPEVLFLYVDVDDVQVQPVWKSPDLRKAQQKSHASLPLVSVLLAQAEGSLGSKTKWERNLHLEWFSWTLELRHVEVYVQLHMLER
ncbi:hypothetical protein Zm00014a_028844 [Zea mays]|uniref:Uncharacterized protein n=1 Tax=Zea mays TaxID=4577 RepID=A0A3L6EY20_MAIZE|nr:hypothetical protein Zm00014a_028844 [Zea mays]